MSCTASANTVLEPRLKVGLNHDWSFFKGGRGRAWVRHWRDDEGAIVDLPHCWNEKDTFQMGVRYYQGAGVYRRRFDLSDDLRGNRDDIWLLESEGFYGTGDVWVNGERMADIDGQYLGFRLDITSRLRFGDVNTIVIRLTNKYHRHVLPGKKMPDFLLHGGLAGRIFLRRLPRVHLDERWLFISTENPLSEHPVVQIEMRVASQSSASRNCTVRCEVRTLSGDPVATTETVPLTVEPHAHCVERACVVLDSPQRWTLDDPHQYLVHCELVEEGLPCDCIEARFGIRKAEFVGDKGFLLNGERIELRGANRHESIPGFGNALPANLHRQDAELMKGMGLNLVRLSHYPQHPAFLDACDEVGLLVYPEIASWKSVRVGRWLAAARRQMRAMMLRDRNRPSIILWGMGNESRSRRAFLDLIEVVRELDPGRPTIYAENRLDRGARDKTLALPDVLGINYRIEALDDTHKQTGHGPLLVSECSNSPFTFRGDDAAELNQIDRFERDLTQIASKPFVAGFALWLFNDYPSQRKKRYQRHAGLVDSWRLPKLSADYMRARYLSRPFLAIHGAWGVDTPQQERQIHIFTNCEHVTLAINDNIVQTLKGAPHLVTRADFVPEVLTVTGVLRGEEVSDRLAPFQPAERIELRPEASTCSAPGRETVGFRVRIVDGRGNRVRNWTGHVDAAVTGVARDRFHCPEGRIPVAGGVGRLFITGSGQPGTASVTVRHPDLEGADATVAFVDADEADRELC